jgi:hypothetical protein
MKSDLSLNLAQIALENRLKKNKYAGYPREVKPNVDANALIHELRKFTTNSL